MIRMPKKLTYKFLREHDLQVEDQDVVAFVSSGKGAVMATFGVEINGVWYYADGLNIPLSKLERRD